jgi:hypothetical protein
MLLSQGDLVFPSDLPRRFLCRVDEVETIGLTSGPFQIMKLAPLEGPWTPSTRLIRTSHDVLVPPRREIWRYHALSRPAAAHHVIRQRGRRVRAAG